MSTVELDFTDLEEVPETQEAQEAQEAPETQSEWPKIIEAENGSAPEGCMSVPAFAEYLTRKFMLAEFEATQNGQTYTGPTGQVLPQSVYQAIKGERNPLPSVIVRYSDGDEVKEKQYVPVAEAEDAWDSRRRGGAGNDDADPAKIAKIAGQRAANLKKAEARLEKVTAQVERLRRLVEKSSARLSDLGLSWDAAHVAYDEFLASLEAEAATENEE